MDVSSVAHVPHVRRSAEQTWRLYDMRVPTNLVTGFLGAGKTTAIQSLLAQRPPGERWSILVNEYGMVSLDHALLGKESAEIAVQELAGGCFCCTTSLELGPALNYFLRQSRPDRLIIEPSGAGHPARVIDLLREAPFDTQLDLRATICLVDPKDYDNPRVVNRAVFQDQIQMADVVVLNWLDKRPADMVSRCRQWIDDFDPPKLLVAETEWGKLDPRWLDLNATLVRTPRYDVDLVHPRPVGGRMLDELPAKSGITSEPASEHGVISTIQLDLSPEIGRPLRLPNQGQGQWACGWIFAASELFDRDELFDALGRLRGVARLKGVFHCDDDWWQINRVGDETSFALSAYRRDSRLEIIVQDEPRDWETIERQLLACRRC
jgi:G3E family GTPase